MKCKKNSKQRDQINQKSTERARVEDVVAFRRSGHDRNHRGGGVPICTQQDAFLYPGTACRKHFLKFQTSMGIPHESCCCSCPRAKAQRPCDGGRQRSSPSVSALFAHVMVRACVAMTKRCEWEGLRLLHLIRVTDDSARHRRGQAGCWRGHAGVQRVRHRVLPASLPEGRRTPSLRCFLSHASFRSISLASVGCVCAVCGRACTHPSHGGLPVLAQDHRLLLNGGPACRIPLACMGLL